MQPWHSIINRMWVTLPFLSTMQASSHLIPSWPTVCEFQDTALFSAMQQLIPWTNSQWVIVLFFCHASHPITNRWWLPFLLPCTLITSHPITNSMWVTLSLFYAIQSHHILMTNRGWVTLLFLSANSYGQLQVLVSDTTIFLPSTSNDKQRVSDTTLIFCHALSWPTSACEWHCPCSLSCTLIIYHPMSNSMWVTLPFSAYILITSVMNSKWVTMHLYSVTHSHHITHLMTNNSMWVMLAFSLPCSLISSYGQLEQQVSDTALVYCHASSSWSSHFIPLPTVCEHYCSFFYHPISSDPISMTNSMWVTFSPFLCHAISSHPTPQSTGCEWHYPSPVKQSHLISSHQDVSDTTLIFSCAISPDLILTNSKWVALHYIHSIFW